MLGIIALAGPSTPYDLKRFVAGSIGYFWTFPHSQLYTEPGRLAAGGLLIEEREQAGRRRRTFAISDAGRRALQAWLAEPQSRPTEIRDLGLLQLFFGALVDHEDVVELARAQELAHTDRLAEYRAIDQQTSGPEMSYPRDTLRLGLAFEEAAVAFWRSMAKATPG